MRLDMDAQDHFVLLDEPCHRLPDDPGLRGEQAEQQRNQAKESP
jgi:hypothetical protein